MSPRRTPEYGELSATARAEDTSPQALLQRRRVQAGQCATCGEKRGRGRGRGWYCATCAIHYNAWKREWAQARRDAGLCVKCGAASPSYARCDDCRERENRARRHIR